MVVAAAGNAALHAELHQRAAAAADAYGALTVVLRDEIAPHARREDAFAADAYRVFLREFLGTSVDLDETYQWGLRQLESVVAEQESIAVRLSGTAVSETLRRLGQRPLPGAWHRRAQGVDAGSVRPRSGIAGRQPLRHRPGPRAPGMPDRSDPADRWHLLHRTLRGPDPSRADVVVGTARCGHVSHLEGNDDVLPSRACQGTTCRSAGRVRDRLTGGARMGCWVSGHGEGWACTPSG